jgi:hypothetical protein
MVMTLLSPAQAEAHLSDVAQQFAQWRQSRSNPHGSRIPEPLWAEALTLAQVLPLTRVARQLGLKPHTLKRRRGDQAGTAGPTGPTRPPRTPPFVEVTADAWRPVTTEVEVHRPDGTRLRITYSDPSPALAPLLQTFLETR